MAAICGTDLFVSFSFSILRMCLFYFSKLSRTFISILALALLLAVIATGFIPYIVHVSNSEIDDFTRLYQVLLHAESSLSVLQYSCPLCIIITPLSSTVSLGVRRLFLLMVPCFLTICFFLTSLLPCCDIDRDGFVCTSMNVIISMDRSR